MLNVVVQSVATFTVKVAAFPPVAAAVVATVKYSPAIFLPKTAGSTKLSQLLVSALTVALSISLADVLVRRRSTVEPLTRRFGTSASNSATDE